MGSFWLGRCVCSSGIAVLGLTVSGCDAQPGNEQVQANSSITMNLPAARPAHNEAVQEEVPATQVVEAPLEPPPVANVSESSGPEQANIVQNESAEENSVAAASVNEAVTAPEKADATVAAKLPLPDAVVARTIERIGFPCGQVTATTAINNAGSGGGYKVTCSSGASYRATIVGGRYRFRRM